MIRRISAVALRAAGAREREDRDDREPAPHRFQLTIVLVIVCVDVDYRQTGRVDAVVTACVGFHAWTDAAPALELVVHTDTPPAAYEPGRFYARELPHLRGVLALVDPPPETIVVDGYVWLAPERPGLGAHLYNALAIPVIGVAKNPFAGAQPIEVVRGQSARPLFVTATGIDAQLAADHVRSMHGAFRIPTLLTRVDQLARA